MPPYAQTKMLSIPSADEEEVDDLVATEKDEDDDLEAAPATVGDEWGSRTANCKRNFHANST
jgi:hypothetical protein